MTLRWWARNHVTWRDMQRLHGFRRGLWNRKWWYVLLGFVGGASFHALIGGVL